MFYFTNLLSMAVMMYSCMTNILMCAWNVVKQQHTPIMLATIKKGDCCQSLTWKRDGEARSPWSIASWPWRTWWSTMQLRHQVEIFLNRPTKSLWESKLTTGNSSMMNTCANVPCGRQYGQWQRVREGTRWAANSVTTQQVVTAICYSAKVQLQQIKQLKSSQTAEVAVLHEDYSENFVIR